MPKYIAGLLVCSTDKGFILTEFPDLIITNFNIWKSFIFMYDIHVIKKEISMAYKNRK